MEETGRAGGISFVSMQRLGNLVMHELCRKSNNSERLGAEVVAVMADSPKSNGWLYHMRFLRQASEI